MVALYAWMRKNIPGALAFMVLMIAFAVWAFGYALEIGSQNPFTAMWALRIQFLGSVTIPVALFSFAARYTTRTWFSKRVILALCVMPILTLIMVWTAHLHGWMWAIVTPGSESGFMQLDPRPELSTVTLVNQTWFWIDMAYGYAIIFASLIIIIRATLSDPQLYREQGWALILGVVLPWVSNIISIFMPSVFGGLNITPFVFTLSSLIFALSIFRLGLLTILPIAYTNIIKNMRDAVFILDAKGKILRLNPAAESMLNRPAKELEQQAAAEAFRHCPALVQHLDAVEITDEITWNQSGIQFEYHLHISAIYGARQVIAGRLVILRDITQSKRAEATLRQSNLDLERRINERTEQLEQINFILRQVANRQALLYQTLRTMSQTLDLDSVTRETLAMISQLTQWKNACLAIPSDPPTHWKIIAAGGALGSEVNVPYPMTAGVIGRTFRTGVTQLVDDTQADPDYLQVPIHEHYLSELAIPVRRVNRILAVLDFESHKVADFTSEDIELGESMAEAIALALDNTFLYANAQRELAERKRAEQELSDTNELLRRHQDELRHELARRKQAEDELAVQRDFAVSVMNTMGNGLTVTNSEGAFEFVNPAFAEMVGRSVQDLLGKFPLDISPASDHPTLLQVRNARLKGQPSTYEMHAQRPDGTLVPLLVTGVPRWRNGQIIGAIASVTDLSDRKRDELEREKLIHELEAKNTELERFTYTVSHDLKSPLITIRGFLGFLEQDARAGNMERVHADSQRIVEATANMQHLLDDLLELSRIGRIVNPPELVSMNELANEAVRMVEGRIHTRNVRVEIAPNLPNVYGDRVRLIEVIQNLIDNSVKFMGNHADPWIRIGVRDSKPPVFFVQDNGIGVDPKFHVKVFELFAQLNTVNEGTGIGLALVKRIVEVHGGTIWVESDGIGKGATFCFTLPKQPGN
jgi:PAS domain S-box-containing protein